jgi:hypothetical protein
MILYHSGGIELLVSERGKALMSYFEKYPGKFSFLISYYYINDKHLEFIKKYRSLFKNIMLDSGAFSAWTQEDPIDLEKYCEYIKLHHQWFSTYVALDVIRDPKGGECSFDNFLIMRNKGLSPMPCFHPLFDEYKWFAEYAKHETYIGLGGMAGKDTDRNAQYRLLDKVFTDIDKERKNKFIKTHGFGIGSPKLVERYPWFTCDSSVILQISVKGMVRWHGRVFSVSEREGIEVKDHLLGLPQPVQKEFEDYVRTEFDCTLAELAKDDAIRYLLSIQQLTDELEPMTNYQKALRFGEQLELPW